jgi:hypothetical protein
VNFGGIESLQCLRNCEALGIVDLEGLSRLRDLQSIADKPVRYLRIVECPEIGDMAYLSELPFKDLTLVGSVGPEGANWIGDVGTLVTLSIDGALFDNSSILLSNLPALKILSLFEAGKAGSLSSLEASQSLDHLALWKLRCDQRLDFVASLRGLSSLIISSDGADRAQERFIDLGPIGRSSLRELEVYGTVVGSEALLDIAALERVTWHEGRQLELFRDNAPMVVMTGVLEKLRGRGVNVTM